MTWFIIFIHRPQEIDSKAVEGIGLYQLISAGFQSSLQEEIIIVSDWNMSQALVKHLLQRLNKTWKTLKNLSRGLFYKKLISYWIQKQCKMSESKK